MIAVMMALVICLVPAFAEDVIHLKSGKTLTGEIVSETEDMIEFLVSVGSIKNTFVLWTGDIESIERDGEGSDTDDASVTNVRDADQINTISNTDVDEIDADLTNKRVFVIPLHGAVGETFRVEQLKQAIDAARPYNPDVIILDIDSPGGLLSEIYLLRDYLREVREEFRIVAWVKSAISAAAMTAFNCREMYFRKEGHIGAATAFSPATGKALEGYALLQWLDAARDIFEQTEYSPHIAQAMVKHDYYLTADREVLPSGEIRITWYEDDSGEFQLSRPNENLVLTASEALKFGVSLGTADNNAEMAEVLNLDGWVEVSDDGRKIMEKWIRTFEAGKKEIRALRMKLSLLGGSQSDLGQRVAVLRELIKWCKRLGPQVSRMQGLDQAALERELKTLLRQMDQ